MRGCARECVQGCACAWCGWNRMCVLKKQERKCVRLRDRMRIGVSMVERESACVCVAEKTSKMVCGCLSSVQSKLKRERERKRERKKEREREFAEVKRN